MLQSLTIGGPRDSTSSHDDVHYTAKGPIRKGRANTAETGPYPARQQEQQNRSSVS